MTNSERALELIVDGMTLGLGSGHAAERFVVALAERVRQGLSVRGVGTSTNTEALAARLGIPLVPLEEAMPIDMTVDGADEVDPYLNLIKGYGHAMVREKIVAAASRKLVILIGPENVDEKVVPMLGRRGKLPIEVVPFSLPLVRRRLTELNLACDLLMDGERPFTTDNGNHIVECRVTAIDQPAALERALENIPGVVGTGLFLGMADRVLIERSTGLEERIKGE